MRYVILTYLIILFDSHSMIIDNILISVSEKFKLITLSSISYI